jgi:hypothetical protein
MSFAETWPKATIDGSDNTDPPPEGSYEVTLVNGSAFTSKKGTDIVKLELRVVGAAEQGYEWTELRSFGSQGAANAAKATCHRLGVDVEAVASLEGLDAQLKDHIGAYYAFNVVRKGEYLNTYIEEATQAAAVPVASEPGSVQPVEDDDVPF